jgi:TRAP-type C4-dicarboxylate transport system permease small subunit
MLRHGVIPAGKRLLGAGITPGRADIEPQTQAWAGAFSAAMDSIDLALRGLLVVLLFGELIMILVEIVRRAAFDMSFLWSEEISRLVILTITFGGGALAYRARLNTSIDAISAMLRPAVRRGLEAFLDQLVLLVSLICVSASLDLFEINSISVMPVLQWSQGWLVMPFIAGLSLTALFAIERLITRHRLAANLAAAIASVVVCTILYVGLVRGMLHLNSSVALALMLVAFFAAVLLGLPVGFAMLAGSMLFLSLTDMAPIVAVAQNTIDGSGHFILLTLPFFIWAGMVMEEGGISVRLIRFAMAAFPARRSPMSWPWVR